jgi:hypothetical protein
MNDSDCDSDYIFVDINNDSIIMNLETSFIIVNCTESKFDKFFKLYKSTNNLMNSTFLKTILPNNTLKKSLVVLNNSHSNVPFPSIL